MIYQHNADGSWTPAERVGWMEEHNRFQRVVLFILGVGHCGKPGWRR